MYHSYLDTPGTVVPLLRDPPHQRPPRIPDCFMLGTDAVHIYMHPP